MNLKEKMQSGKYFGPILITTDSWFFADNGEFKGAYGRARFIKAEDFFGFKPERSTDWALEFEGGLLIFGCQIHYLQFTNVIPEFLKSKVWTNEKT